MIESAPSPRAMVPASLVMLPPDIDFVESGWSAPDQAPMLRVFLRGFPSVTVPTQERISLGADVDDFGATDIEPVDASFKAYRITSAPSVPGGLSLAVAADERIIRVGSLLSTLGGVVRIGADTLVKIAQQKVLGLGGVEVTLAQPIPSAFPAGTSVNVFVGSDITTAVTLVDSVLAQFHLNRASAGIGSAEVVDLLLVYRNVVAVPGVWSVYLVPRVDLDKILVRSALPAGFLQYTGVGQAGVPLLEITLPTGAVPADWHGADIIVGVSLFREMSANFSTPEGLESAITWIPATTLVAPPTLTVLGIGQDNVQLGIEHPVGARGVGTTVIRYPGSGTLAGDGEDLTRRPVAAGVFTDGAVDPDRRVPGNPENGPPYPAPDDVLTYTAVEDVDTPWVVSAIRRIGRRDVSPVPFTRFPSANQQAKILVTDYFVRE